MVELSTSALAEAITAAHKAFRGTRKPLDADMFLAVGIRAYLDAVGRAPPQLDMLPSAAGRAVQPESFRYEFKS